MDEIDRVELSDGDLPDPYMPNWKSLTTEGNFEEAFFELLKEAGVLAVMTVSVVPEAPLTRNEAILQALLARSALLSKSLCSDAIHNSGYQQLPITRQLLEVTSNYLYLTNPANVNMFDEFVKKSVLEDKRTLSDISQQIENRENNELQIETRMRLSIARTASAGDINQAKVTNSRWPNAFIRLGNVSPVAYVAFRAGSAADHGQWSDLFLQELTQIGDGFIVDVGRRRSSSKSLGSSCLLLYRTFDDYFTNRAQENIKVMFQERFRIIADKLDRLTNLHEELINS